MEGTRLATPPAATKPSAPVMDVKPAPAPAGSPQSAHQSEPAKPPKPQAAPKNKGAGGAIFATVIIVLGLAALAVYAYLKQPK